MTVSKREEGKEKERVSAPGLSSKTWLLNFIVLILIVLFKTLFLKSSGDKIFENIIRLLDHRLCLGFRLHIRIIK